MRKEILLPAAAYTTVSLATLAVGTAEQTECIDTLKEEHGVSLLEDLPGRVLDDSGCLSIMNTAGLGGTALGSGVMLYAVFANGREQEPEPTFQVTTG